MLPKGTVSPNSGNISSNMTRAQIIKTQNKYCGKSGVVYVTGSTGNMGHTGNTGPIGPTGTFNNITEINATLAIRTPFLTTYGPSGLNIGTPFIGINIGALGTPGAPGTITIGASSSGVPNTITTLKGTVEISRIDAAFLGTAVFPLNVMTIGSNLTSGSLAIGGIGQTGNILLGTGQTTGVLNIGTGARSLEGEINIGTGVSSLNPIYIGGNSSTTIKGKLNVNGNITMGSTGTIYTTLAQQIRLGHAHTQTSGTISSSYGPFFKSFGPATVTGTTYDILYEGPDGLFTPTGLDGVGGLLTIVLKSTSSKMATLTYNLMKLNGYSGFNSLTAMTNVFGGWTTNPTIEAGTGNNIRITFDANDWSSTTVSWMFMGAI